MSFGSKTTKQSQTQQSQSDPWDVAIPDLTEMLSRLRTAGTGLGSLSPDETGAIDALKTQAGAGNPWEADISKLTDRAFSTPSQSGTVTDAYKRLVDQLTPYASGSRIDVSSDPNLQKLLTLVGDDASNRVNSMFAAAGRDFSGAHLGNVAKEVSNAQLPVLVGQYNTEAGRQIDAAKALYGAGADTATKVQGLDRDAFETALTGVGLSKEALAAKGYGPEQILQLEELAKRLPVDQLGSLAKLLAGIGGLGSQSQGTATGTSKTNAFNISLADVGKGLGAIGAL